MTTDNKFNPIRDAPMGKLLWVVDWALPHGKKRLQQESLPAREVRNSIKARVEQPNYGTALDEQNAKRNMVIFRKDSLKLVG